MNNYIYFIESEFYPIEESEDLRFLLEFKSGDKKLITEKSGLYQINFVGEVSTPNNTYFSFPKNFKQDEDQVDIIKKVIKKIQINEEGKKLVFSGTGNYNAEKIYFDKLKSYFLDYITYEFIYPLKRTLNHTNTPILGARIDISATTKNRKRYGTGITYKVKDIDNSDSWMIDDIYYHTLEELEERCHVSEKDKRDIERMKKYLISEGFNINKKVDNIIYSSSGKKLCDLSNSNEVIDKINKSDVGIIHTPIKKTLLDYYKDKLKASAKVSLNLIFTTEFENAWELMVRDCLLGDSSSMVYQNSKNLKKQLEKTNLGKTEVYRTFVPLRELELYKGLPLNPQSTDNIDAWLEKRGSRFFHFRRYRKLIPDIIVEFNSTHSFIGDAKYYKDPSSENTYYDKEMYLYNIATNNQYPVVIFAATDRPLNSMIKVPSNGFRSQGDYDLLITLVSIPDLMFEYLQNTGRFQQIAKNIINKFFENDKPMWQSSL